MKCAARYSLARGNRSRAFSAHRFIVPDRGYLELSGTDVKKFLQGVCTNDVNKLKNHGDCIAAAFLTPKGRILADGLLYCIQDPGDQSAKMKIVVEAHLLSITPLSSYLSMYKLRSKVKISPSMNYLSILDDNEKPDDQLIDIKEDAKMVGMVALISSKDPRMASIGTRHLLHIAPKKIVEEIVDDASIRKNVSRKFSPTSRYHFLRLLNGLVEGPEIVNRIPLECNLDLLNYVDFAKGCYVGQELTARTKFKGLVRKRVLPFLRESLYPSRSSDGVNFSPVDNSVVDGVKPFTGQTGLITDIGKIMIFKNSDTTIEPEPELNVGEIIGISPDGDVCCALVRLENVLPQNAAERLPRFDCLLSQEAISNLNHSVAAESGEASAKLPSSVFSSVCPIRPPFWVERDPITHNRLDTHEN